MAVLTFLYLFRRAAPYGRHYGGAGWGPHISTRLAWVIMELPAPVLFLVVYLDGKGAFQIVPLLFLVMWQGHYLNRTFVYPFRVRARGRKTPLLLVGSGFFFNAINAYIHARFISEFGEYATDWLADPRFLIGVGIFLAGLALNLHADNTLMRLRPARRDRLRDTAGRRVPVRLVPELPRRNPRMAGLGGRDLVVVRPCIHAVHRRQSCPEGAEQPSLVSGDVQRLSGAPPGPDTGHLLRPESLIGNDRVAPALGPAIWFRPCIRRLPWHVPGLLTPG